MRLRNLTWIWLLPLIGGCRATDQPPTTQKPNSAPPAAVSTSAAFDDTKGDQHKPSGIGFVYPSDWQHDEAQGEETDTSLGLNRPGIAIATLFWTEMAEPPKDLGQQKYSELREIYHETVSPPAFITIAGQPGYEI